MSRSIQYAVVDTAADADRQVIEAALRDYNRHANPSCWSAQDDPANDPRPLTVLSRLDDEVVGGLIGDTRFLWLRIHILSVVEDHRRQGIGRQLLAAAEAEAMVRGCRYAYVDTMDYQSPAFYEKHGYRVVGCLQDWDSHDHSKYLFTKELGT